MSSKEKDLDLASPNVLTKYKAAANIINKALDMVLSNCKPKVKIVDLCEKGDKYIRDHTEDIYASVAKGIAFPTCISVNETVCHFSPLANDESVLEVGDILKIDMGCHIDGFIAVVAHTLVLQDGVVTGSKANVITAAATAAEVAIGLVRPGKKNKDVNEAVQKVAAAYKCKIVEGVLSHQMKQFLIDGNKVASGVSLSDTKVDDAEFEENEVYSINIVMSTGEGKPKQLDEKPTTIYKRAADQNDHLKMKDAPFIFGEISRNFPSMPFSARALGEKCTPADLADCAKHNLLQPYPVLCENQGDLVAHIKFTVLLRPNGSDRVTSHALQQLEPTVKVDDPDINDWLSLAKQTRKIGGRKKKKKKGNGGEKSDNTTVVHIGCEGVDRQKRMKRDQLNQRLCSHIPDDHVEDILLRLPVRSLLRFRCISQRWSSLISGKEFVNAHLEKSSKNINRLAYFRFLPQPENKSSRFPADISSLKPDDINLLFQDDFKVRCRFYLRQIVTAPVGQSVTAPVVVRDLDLTLDDPMDTGCKIVGTANGLYCIREGDKGFILWNPSTSWFRRLLVGSIDPDLSICDVVDGFGFSDQPDYKVLTFTMNDPDVAFLDPRVRLYSLREDSWKTLDNKELIYLGNTAVRGTAVVVGGKFHWAKFHDGHILSFDLLTESFGTVVLPGTADYNGVNSNPVLTEFEKDLCCLVSRWSTTRRFTDIWVLNDTWSIIFTIIDGNDPGDMVYPLYGTGCYPLLPLCKLAQGVLIMSDGELAIYNTSTESWEKILPDFPGYTRGRGSSVGLFHETLVSPFGI